MKNKGASKLLTTTNIIMAFVALGILGIWDPIGLFGGQPARIGPTQPTQPTFPADLTSCVGGESQSLDLNAADIDKPTTSLTEANNIHRLCGSMLSLGAWTEGTALTGLNTGECYEVITGISGTAASCYDNSYGPFMRINNLPCVMSRNIPLFQDEVEGSVVAAFYNSNHDAAYEVLTASTPKIFYMRFYTAEKEYYGNPYIGEPGYTRIDFNAIKAGVPGVQFIKGSTISGHRPEYPNMVCLQLNSTGMNAPKWIKAQLQDGSVVEMNRVSIPKVHSAAAAHADYCYEAPLITGDYIEFQVKYDPTATPNTDDDVASLYAASWYGHTDTGEILWGVEDNDGAAIGASNPDTLAIDFTA